MTFELHTEWLWLIPAIPIIAFMVWVLWNFHREGRS
jgi:hypothetical protein